ncbi:hypothetical protein niasHS_013684 [Heterodera schachtii]|uniref:Uncharacterized protein n=1 Tax=Heterodera schachtii TaxID=97005 RepID=A0ABD2IAK2_HETSC
MHFQYLHQIFVFALIIVNRAHGQAANDNHIEGSGYENYDSDELEVLGWSPHDIAATRNTRRQAAAAAAAQNQGNTVSQSRTTVATPRSSRPTVAQTSSAGPTEAPRQIQGARGPTHFATPARPSRPTVAQSSSSGPTEASRPNRDNRRGLTRSTTTTAQSSRPTVQRSSSFSHTVATQQNHGTMRGRSRTSRSSIPLSGNPSRSTVDSAGQTSRSTVDSPGQTSPSTVDSPGQSSLSNLAYSAGQKLLEIGTSLFESANSYGQSSDAASSQPSSSAGKKQSDAYDLLFSDADNMTANLPPSSSSLAASTSGFANHNETEQLLLEHAIAESLKLKENEDIEKAKTISISEVRTDFRNKAQLSIDPEEFAMQKALMKQIKKERKLKKRYKRGAFPAA